MDKQSLLDTLRSSGPTPPEVPGPHPCPTGILRFVTSLLALEVQRPAECLALGAFCHPLPCRQR
jgi:hypothetical protein